MVFESTWVRCCTSPLIPVTCPDPCHFKRCVDQHGSAAVPPVQHPWPDLTWPIPLQVVLESTWHMGPILYHYSDTHDLSHVTSGGLWISMGPLLFNNCDTHNLTWPDPCHFRCVDQHGPPVPLLWHPWPDPSHFRCVDQHGSADVPLLWHPWPDLTRVTADGVWISMGPLLYYYSDTRDLIRVTAGV